MDRQRLRAAPPQGTVSLSATLPPPGSGGGPPRGTGTPGSSGPTPRRFGPYELRRLLGRGGMGEVYHAYDTVRDREVALKLLATHLAADASFQARFRQESQVAARLADPHIIPIHDFGEIEGRLFIDMRLVSGRDLAVTLRDRHRLPVPVALDIVEQVASALDAAHAQGLVHRDVKPSNILLADTGTRPFAYLVDFGIARPMSEGTGALTTASGAYGTVAYLAPERIRGDSGDPRTDVYALACVLFETLTGRRPWDGDIYTVLSGHMTKPPPSLSAEVPGSPPGLDTTIQIGMAKKTADRFGSAGDFARAAVASARPTTPPHPPMGSTAARYGTAPPVPPTAPPTTPQRTFARPPVPGRPPRRSVRGPLLAVLGVLLLAAGITTAVVLGSGGSGTPDARRTSTSPSASPLPSGSGSAVRWSDFAAFTKLVGTRDNDTARSFSKVACTLSKGGGPNLPTGVVSQVRCNSTGNTFGLGLFRFDTAAHLDELLQREFQTGNYVAKPWGRGGTAYGLRISQSSTTADSAILTTLCSLPNYLISVDSVNFNALELQDNIWGRMTFPDRRPAACKDDFAGPDGPVGSVAMDDTKQDVLLGPSQIAAFLKRFAGPGPQAAGSTDGATEYMVVVGKSRVHFWNVTPDDGLRFLGLDNYPPIGARPYSVLATGATDRPLPGMHHITFILYGPFLTGNSNAALVYTRSQDDKDAWSPAALTDAGVLRFSSGRGTVFSSARFLDARTLMTSSQSGKTTTWKWDGTGFSPVK